MTEPVKHSVSDIWNAVRSQGDQISEIKAAQRATDEKLSGVTDGIGRLERTIHDLIERQNRPTNWLGVASLFFTMVTGMVAFVILQTNPLYARTSETRQALADVNEILLDRAYVMGRDNMELEWHRTWLGFIEAQLDVERARNADIEERASKMEGRQEMLKDQLAEVDAMGSRWLNRQRQQ